MYLSKLNLLLLLLLLLALPSYLLADGPNREVILFLPDFDHYWQQHERELPIQLSYEIDGESYVLDPIGSEGDQQYVLHYFIPELQDQTWVQLTLEGETESFLLPEGDERAFLVLNERKLFPHSVEVFSLHEVQKMLEPRMFELDGQIQINEDLQGAIPEKIYVHKPFGELGKDQEEFVAYSEPSLDWRKLSFVFDLEAEFNSIAFVELQGRFYPVVIHPYGEREIDWVAEPGHEKLRMQMAREWERDRPTGQNFFNQRYPYGLEAAEYRNLVNAFVGDRKHRADTLIAWSRGIEEIFGNQYGQTDEFLMMINQIGNTSRLDIYGDVFMSRLHRLNHDARSDRDTIGEILLVGTFLSLLLFVIAAIMRLRGSRLITAQRLTALEMALHSFIWINMGIFVLSHFRAGSMIIESPAHWIMYCLPIATFYINILYLIPNLLMKRRWLWYLMGVGGLLVAFFFISLIAGHSFLDNLNLVSINGQWDWIYTSGGLTYSGASESMLGLQLALIPIALVYGLVRHLLLNRLPGLQRQKEALNAELNTLKHQIS
ncbi:MAG: hypothetical protein AAFY36_19150, partial [Bacteroidota bacterium]